MSLFAMQRSCVSAATPLTVNAAPTAPAAPTASVTVQPTCAVPTGTIVITAPTGAGLDYSIDGITYTTATGTFTGVAPGTYNVTVRNAAGCVSAATSLTVNAAPTAPAAPTASVTVQPTCAVPTGTIVVTAPTGAGLNYSIDGVTYTNTTGTFTGVAPGTYNVTVQRCSWLYLCCNTTHRQCCTGSTCCTNSYADVQPTCAVTNRNNCHHCTNWRGLKYSIDGTTYQASPTFNAVAPGTYNVTVRDAAWLYLCSYTSYLNCSRSACSTDTVTDSTNLR